MAKRTLVSNTFQAEVDARGAHFGNGDAHNVFQSEPAQDPPSRAETVGVVTAIAEEYAAMAALLDDPRDESIPGDRSLYTTGSVESSRPGSPHQVVLTLLPEAGNQTAATACTNLVRSFPNARYVLMCGIAAGVPYVERPGRHVRLGDIVVATWGIVEYDHVDITSHGARLRAGIPQPSPVLVTAAEKLHSLELRNQRPWEKWLQRGGEGELDRFARPSPETDVVLGGDDQDMPIPHPPLDLSGHRPGWPKVHRGLIGSADWSLRNAQVRDILAALHDLRALEMEGKGIARSSFLNGLDWLVVRGVSDYGDRHTRDVWRCYAALAAAAYVRALLAVCPPVE